MTGIDDVARLAGVSTATVSRALSGRGPVSAAARARVEAAAERLGYVVSASASSLATGRTRNVGVLMPFVDLWFFSAVLSGAASALQRAGYDITLYQLTPDPAQRREIFETFLRRGRVDGVIAVGLDLGDDEFARLRALGLPIVLLGGPRPGLTSLTVDDVAVARTATEHLVSLGHRDIAHIGAQPEFDIDYRIPSRRQEGFAQALADSGIRRRPDLIERADFTVRGGFEAATRLLALESRPTAIFAASDEMAIGAILAARERGCRVPDDLSIVGVDGHELGEFFRLTTVDQFPRGQGERAAAALLAALDPGALGGAAGVETLPHEFVVRGSTAPPPR